MKEVQDRLREDLRAEKELRDLKKELETVAYVPD
jgi:hypothetical protein